MANLALVGTGEGPIELFQTFHRNLGNLADVCHAAATLNRPMIRAIRYRVAVKYPGNALRCVGERSAHLKSNADAVGVTKLMQGELVECSERRSIGTLQIRGPHFGESVVAQLRCRVSNGPALYVQLVDDSLGAQFDPGPLEVIHLKRLFSCFTSLAFAQSICSCDRCYRANRLNPSGHVRAGCGSVRPAYPRKSESCRAYASERADDTEQQPSGSALDVFARAHGCYSACASTSLIRLTRSSRSLRIWVHTASMYRMFPWLPSLLAAATRLPVSATRRRSAASSVRSALSVSARVIGLYQIVDELKVTTSVGLLLGRVAIEMEMSL